jgi:hypothetical protein
MPFLSTTGRRLVPWNGFRLVPRILAVADKSAADFVKGTP